MWISQKVNKDPEIKKTLQEINKLIKRYSDATNIYKEDKLFIAKMDVRRFFKPKSYIYAIIIAGTIITEGILLSLGILKLSILNTWVSLSLNISLPILVLGISLSAVAKSLSESSRFASDYLRDSCNTTIFACITFLTVFLAYISSLLFPTIRNSNMTKIIYLFISSFSVGGAIWCLVSLIYIILETTKCMYPEYSFKAASNYASRKLSYAFLIEVYNSVWMGKYSEILSGYLKNLKNIHQSYGYLGRDLLQKKKEDNDTSGEYQIYLPQEVNFNLGFRDYNLSKLEKIDELMESKNAKLYLAPHGLNSKEFGVLSYEEPCSIVYDTISKEISSICRFREDKHVEKEKGFWEEYYLKLHSALSRAAKDVDIAQFREYLKSIEDIYFFLRKACKDSVVRKHFTFDYKKARYLFLYSKSVRWLLESTNKIEEDILELFLDALVESIWQQVRDEVRNGDWYALEVFNWLIPETYKLFHELVKDNKSRLWELRARIGGFYDFAGSLLSEYESDITEDDKLQIQLVLHKGIIKWLLIAIDNKDDELIKSLCEAARRLIFQNKQITFVPQRLITQHFILCGKILEFLMDKKPNVSPDIFKLLCFDKYDHTARMNVNFDELVNFFIESRQSDLRSFLYEFSSTNWERNPLRGGGFGTPHYTFSGNIELDYMFIYLALLSIPLSPDVKPIQFRFSSYNLKDKIDKFNEIARGIDIYDYPSSKEKLIQWLDGCDQLYKQEEEDRIATAPLDEQIVSQYKDAFWDGYKSVKTFLSFCISQGYCSINNEVSVKDRYVHHKSIFIDGDTTPHSIAQRDGADISRSYDKKLLKEIVKSKTENEIADTITSQLNLACRWLTKEGTNKENGIILFYVKADIQSELYNNDFYIPSWKEDTNLVFSGYYKNYPMIEIYDPKIEPKCVALNLQGWKGLEIRPEVIEKDILGEIDIREWTEQEINKSIKKGKIKEEDRNSVKGQCPVEYELFWRLDKKVLPKQIEVSLKKREKRKG